MPVPESRKKDVAREDPVHALPGVVDSAPAHGRGTIRRWPILARLGLLMLLAALTWAIVILFITSI